MNRLDIVRLRGGALAINCQADTLSHLSTRFTVPLLLPESVPDQIPGLHPEFTIAGKRLVMATHLAGAVPVRSIERTIGSLADEDYVVQRALDTLSGSY